MDSSIDVHVYAGNSAWAGGTFVASGRANLATDGNVASACQARGNAYWFKIPLDGNLRSAHGGKALYVHGISPWGGDHLTINRSGTFTVPAVVRSAEFVSFNAYPTNITNGRQSTLTIQVRNTGNVVWDGNTYLAWGQDQLDQSRALAGPVSPGGIASFSIDVAPYHDGIGIRSFAYIAQMATNGMAWGPRPYTMIAVENADWYCPPNSTTCEAPM